MGGTPSSPSSPTPKEMALAGNSTNISTALANTHLGQVNRIAPGGSLNFEQTGTYTHRDPFTGQEYELPQFTATTSLSETGQQAFDAGERAQASLTGAAENQAADLNSYFSSNGIPSAPQFERMGAGDYSADRQRVEDAIMSRMQPQIDRDRESLDTRLANQGITLGSEAYNREMERFDRGVNDARLSAVMAGGQEQNRLVGLERDRAGFNNTVSEAELASEFNRRNQGINEVNSMLGGMQIPNFPVPQPAGIPTMDVAGMMQQDYQNRYGAYQNRQERSDSLLGGMLGLGTNLLMI